jgi:beta-aspartyl-peptidase (threonine type)
LEDSPLFNAGKGSVFTAEGKNEMDASIMEGKTLKAGAVAGVQIIKNPITAALCVMQKSPHVMMTGKGAEKFAKTTCLCETADSSYFFEQKRWNGLQKAKEAEKAQLDHGSLTPNNDSKFGTVGVVALDKDGNLSAGTSTGGMTNKKHGRVGDSPIIGAGTYANNKTCGVSCTGHGEYFIRSVVAYDVSALMEYKGYSVDKAANEVVMKKLVSMGGEGGLIAMDRKGNITMPFNSAGMYRGYMKSNGKKEILIYKK